MHTPSSATQTPEHPVFDPDVLGAMFGNESAVITSVLQTFETGTRDNLAALAQAVATHDLRTTASLAHKITGACRMSGALALAHAAHNVEKAAQQGDAAAVRQGITGMNAQWPLVQAAMAALTATR
jgi:HPt (histidine-containing phosphotransfer) domain-containing protein